MILTRLAAPADALVSITQAKAHCRVDGDDDTLLLSELIDTAEDYLDGPSGILGRALVDQTWSARLASWPSVFVLPVEPVRSVVITYVDQAGASRTLAGDQYRLVQPLDAAPQIQWASGVSLPALAVSDYPIEINMLAGFGSPTEVPPAIQRAALMMVEHWFANRGVMADGRQEMPLAASALLARYRRVL